MLDVLPLAIGFFHNYKTKAIRGWNQIGDQRVSVV